MDLEHWIAVSAIDEARECVMKASWHQRYASQLTRERFHRRQPRAAGISARGLLTKNVRTEQYCHYDDEQQTPEQGSTIHLKNRRRRSRTQGPLREPVYTTSKPGNGPLTETRSSRMAPMMNSLADNLPESNRYIERERYRQHQALEGCDP